MSNNWKKHLILDLLIFNLSKKYNIYDSIKLKKYIFFKKTRYISNFNPIIIGGCPRSGTTLARALISVHPEIVGPEKEYNLLMWIKKESILQNVFNFSKEEIYDLKERYKDHVLFAEQVLKKYLNKQKKENVCIKHPYHIMIIDELFNFFPELRFIHIIRDGRDVTCSLRTHPKRKIVNDKIIPLNTNNPFDWCVRKWVSSINKGKNHRKNKRYIEIRYEDLVNEPEKTTERVFSFLGLKNISREKLLEFYKNQDTKKHIQNIEVNQPIYKKTIGRWKKDMSREEQKIFKKITGDLLIELGYEKNKNW